jgi:ABC-type lipoprotein release transport system permease subunit
MPILMRIAIRNLRQHKSKTLIIGILIALGIFILTLGNSVLATLSEATQRTFIDSFTGHILVRATGENPVTIEGASGFGGDPAGQTVPDYDEVYAYVTSVDNVLAANPQITSFGTVDFSTEEKTRAAIAPIFGIEPEAYLAMFPDSIRLLEGRFLEPGEQGIVLPRATVEDIREDLGENVAVGDELKIQGFSGGGPGGGGGGSIRIRRLILVGIYEYAAEGADLQPYAFVDASTVRALSGLVVGTADAVNIDAADSSLLDAGDDLFGTGGSDEDLFGSDALFSDDALFGGEIETVETDLNEENLFGILGDTSARTLASRPDAGAWSYLLVRLESDAQTNSTVDEMNAYFAEQGMDVEAVDWSVAAGSSALLNTAFQVFFYIVVIILAVVAVIIIMNTLVISVIERTKEIGTMRSLGAKKNIVREMFIAETMSISLVFGTIGLVLGAIVILIINRVGIPAGNQIVELIFGGSVFRPVFDPMSILTGYLIMLGIGLVSSWYPVRVALKIQPVEAMQSV